VFAHSLFHCSLSALFTSPNHRLQHLHLRVVLQLQTFPPPTSSSLSLSQSTALWVLLSTFHTSCSLRDGRKMGKTKGEGKEEKKETMRQSHRGHSVRLAHHLSQSKNANRSRFTSENRFRCQGHVPRQLPSPGCWCNWRATSTIC
jgi:hypothetical protein